MLESGIMSLFDGISNVRKPEVNMNSGPLPTAGPPYFPSARINYAADLLGDHIDAYSYGSADHLSDQTSYLNIAHRIQKIIPQISLPNASSEGTFQLSHAVDVGDIGFVLRIDRRGMVVPNINAFDRLQLSRMVDPIVNLVTVNYILAGLQRYWKKREAANWQQLMVDLRFVDDAYAERSNFTAGDALRFVNDMGTARPFGVPHTSEMQGGQHEGGSGPVTYPVNFISTLFISGLTRNICNIWSQNNISAGDDLILKLEKLPISTRDGSIKYHLNHWKKSIAIQQFRYEEGGVNEAWQLVPAVLSSYKPSKIVENYDYRENGYWHICRSQVMFRNESFDDRRFQDASNVGVYHDDRVSMRGALIEATFEPVWVEYIPWTNNTRGEKRIADWEPSAAEPREQRRVHPMPIPAPAALQALAPAALQAFLGAKQLETSVSVSTTLETEKPEEDNPSERPAEQAESLKSKPPTIQKKPRRTMGLVLGASGGPLVVQSIAAEDASRGVNKA